VAQGLTIFQGEALYSGLVLLLSRASAISFLERTERTFHNNKKSVTKNSSIVVSPDPLAHRICRLFLRLRVLDPFAVEPRMFAEKEVCVCGSAGLRKATKAAIRRTGWKRIARRFGVANSWFGVLKYSTKVQRWLACEHLIALANPVLQLQ
jgi:hypothetical protein